MYYVPIVKTNNFLVLDIETFGGSFSTFPQGFELLLVGIRTCFGYTMYTSEPASLELMRSDLADFNGQIVTFNGARFDIPLLEKFVEEILGDTLKINFHYDLLAEIHKATGRRISLDNLSNYTIGAQKLPWDHRKNLRAWREAPEEIIAYNKIDLDLTYDLYLRVLNGQHLFLGDTSVVLSL